MDEPKKRPAERTEAAEARAQRLAQAMRANLRRRKEQVRGRTNAAAPDEDPVQER